MTVEPDGVADPIGRACAADHRRDVEPTPDTAEAFEEPTPVERDAARRSGISDARLARSVLALLGLRDEEL